MHLLYPSPMLEILLGTTLPVALAEMGDKTQLLALLLAARFRKPWQITWGILVATVANPLCAAAVGGEIAHLLGPQPTRWLLAVSFLGMAVWMLIPDKLADDEVQPRARGGVFLTTVCVFFLAEMGDKTQLATVALMMKYASLWLVVCGTTLGMLLANVPVVFFGERLTRRLPAQWLHRIAAALFAAFGLFLLLPD